MWCRIACALAALGGVVLGAPARASGVVEEEPASVQLGAPGAGVSIDRAAIALRVGPGGVGATLTLSLSLSTRRADAQEVVLPIAVPRGGDVTGLTITIDGARVTARALPAGEARARYDETVRWRRDPALLEWASSSDAHDQLRLRVFPIARDHDATVELTIALPRASNVVIDPGGQTIGLVEARNGDGAPRGWIELRAPVTIALPAPAALAEAWNVDSPLRRPRVDPSRSMFAGEQPGAPTRGRRRVAVITCGLRIGSADAGIPSVSAAEIRTTVRLHHPQLRTCYQRAAQRDHALAGDAVLHFTIDARGAVGAAQIDGTLRDAEVFECLAREVATWRFREGSGLTAVNYPLRFQLGER